MITSSACILVHESAHELVNSAMTDRMFGKSAADCMRCRAFHDRILGPDLPQSNLRLTPTVHRP
jgi:hypothetical protein